MKELLILVICFCCSTPMFGQVESKVTFDSTLITPSQTYSFPFVKCEQKIQEKRKLTEYIYSHSVSGNSIRLILYSDQSYMQYYSSDVPNYSFNKGTYHFEEDKLILSCNWSLAKPETCFINILKVEDNILVQLVGEKGTDLNCSDIDLLNMELLEESYSYQRVGE